MAAQTSILKYLQENNLVNDETVRKVLLERSRTNKTEEAIIKDLNVVSDLDLTKAKSAIFGIPFVDLSTISVPESIIAEIPIDNLAKYRAVPFERIGNVVKIAMEDPFDIQATQALLSRYPQGTRMEVYISPKEGIGLILDRRVGDLMSSQVTEALEDVGVPVTEITEDESGSAMGGLNSADLASAPIARIVNSIMDGLGKQGRPGDLDGFAPGKRGDAVRILAPDDHPGSPQKDGRPHRDDHQHNGLGTARRPDGQPFKEQPDNAPHSHRPHKGHGQRKPHPDPQGDQRHGPEHDEFPMGEIDQLRGTVEHGNTHGDDRIDGPGGDA